MNCHDHIASTRQRIVNNGYAHYVYSAWLDLLDFSPENKMGNKKNKSKTEAELQVADGAFHILYFMYLSVD